MTSVVAQTRSIPLRKMELLAEELRHLKSGIDLMSGRLDLMLAEIAHLQDDYHSKEQGVGQTEVQSPPQASMSPNSDMPVFAEGLNTASPCTSQDAHAIDDARSAVAATEEEALPPAEPVVSADHDAIDARPDTVTLSVGDSISSDGCEAESIATAILETPPSAASELPTAIAAKSAGASIASPNVGADAANVIVLDERRKTSPRRAATRAVAHCAASLAMIALLVAVATGSGFAEFLVSKVPAAPDPLNVLLHAP
jgi:hypothetical protein